jgi:hypothetical protein
MRRDVLSHSLMFGWSVVAWLAACDSAPLDVIERRAEVPGGSSSGGGGASTGATGGSPLSAGAGGASGASVAPEPPSFGAPELIANVAHPGADDDPALTADLLELYFSSDREGRENIFVARRATPNEPFGQPVAVDEINSEFVDATPGLTPDGLTLYFESTRRSQTTDLQATDIWRATRASRASAWSEPVLVEELSSDERESMPQPSSPLLMTFSAVRPMGVGDTDIYVTLRAAVDAPWGLPGLLFEVSSASWDQGLLRADGTQIFISSGRDQGRARGGELYWSARPSFGAAFLPPVALTDLNTEADEQDLWVSESLDYAVFASDRDGNLDLYEARRR